MAMRIIWMLALVGSLTACSTVAPPVPQTAPIPFAKRQAPLSQIHSWTLNGKIAVITATDSGSATVDWSQNQHQYNISLMGPLGSGGFKLAGRPGNVTLQMSDGKTYSASSPEALLAQHWGYHLPVSSLNYWIRGIPVPSVTAGSHYDSAGHLSQLSQQGWDIQYPSYTHVSGVDLPSRIFLTSDTLKVKIVVYQWKVG